MHRHRTPSLAEASGRAENLDGLPVGFARMTGVADPATGVAQPDKIGLTCAACHTGSIHYKGTSIRFDGGPAMVELAQARARDRPVHLPTPYAMPFRFDRFADRVLGRDAARRTATR